MKLRNILKDITSLIKIWFKIQLAEPTTISHRTMETKMKKYCYLQNVRISDSGFETFDYDTMKSLIKANPLKNKNYKAEKFDCDNFSFAFAGFYKFILPDIAIGIIWSRTHAFNFFIDDLDNIYGIEPQTGEIFAIIDKKQDIQLMMI